MHKKGWHWLIFLLFLPAVLLAQQTSKVIHFEQYTTKEGLSHNHVYQTFKDSRGIIWILTETALNRFDGRSFKPIPQVKISDRITRIYLEDQDGDLWIGDSKKTIVCFNIYTEQVVSPQQKFGSKFPSKIAGAIRSRTGAYILHTEVNEISLFHPKQGITHTYKSEKGILTPIGETEDGLLWIQENYWPKKGCFLALDAEWKEMAATPFYQDIAYTFGVFEGHKLYYFTRDSFFTADKNGFEKRTSLHTIYPKYHPDSPLSTGSLHTSAVNPRTGGIVFSSQHHMFEFSPALQLTYDFKDAQNRMAFPEVFHITVDEEGYIWLSTFNGLFKVWFTSNPFRQFLVTPAQDDPTSELKSCRSIFKGSDGRIYVSANRCLYAISGNSATTLICRRVEEGPIWAMYMDDKENLWYKDLKIRRYSIREKKEYSLDIPMPSGTSWVMKQIGHRLWMGNNLAWLDMQDNTYHLFDGHGPFQELKAYSVYDIQQAGNHLWMMGESGLYRLDAEAHVTDRYWSGGAGEHYLPCDDYRHLYQEADTSWWLATASGLLHLNPQNHHYRLYSMEDGLPNNKCHAVIPDDNGFLWVSTDNGIVQFEKNTGHFRVYYESDGLGLNEFNRLSYYRDAEGMLYFGGINGGVSFHPDVFADAFKTSPQIQMVVTECHISSGSSQGETDLRAAFRETGRIEIDPSQSFLHMQFVLTDYANPLKTIYRYKIDGLNEWKEMENGELQLAGLPYGTYTLRVMARTSSGLTIENLQIPLMVLRPFYLKSWFIITVLLLLGSLWIVYKKHFRPLPALAKEARQQLPPAMEVADRNRAEIPEKKVQPESKNPMLKYEDSVLLERLEAIVMQHLEDADFDASALTKAVGISHSHLHRKLTDLTGLSTGRYIHSIRLKEAMRRIVSTTSTISEIAYQTGFSDPAYFTRLFTKMYEHPPSYFREGGK